MLTNYNFLDVQFSILIDMYDNISVAFKIKNSLMG